MELLEARLHSLKTMNVKINHFAWTNIGQKRVQMVGGGKVYFLEIHLYAKFFGGLFI